MDLSLCRPLDALPVFQHDAHAAALAVTRGFVAVVLLCSDDGFLALVPSMLLFITLLLLVEVLFQLLRPENISKELARRCCC